MTPSDARQLMASYVQNKLSSVYATIKLAASAGNDKAYFGISELDSQCIRQLQEDGFDVDADSAFELRGYWVSW